MGPTPQISPTSAQSSFLPPDRSDRPNRLIHISTTAIGCRTMARSTSTRSFILPSARFAGAALDDRGDRHFAPQRLGRLEAPLSENQPLARRVWDHEHERDGQQEKARQRDEDDAE